MNAFKIRSVRTIHHHRHTVTHFGSLWEYHWTFFLQSTLQWDINPARSVSEWLRSGSRCRELSYVNAGLTSAVRSKRGRGTLEPRLPPTHTHSLTLLCSQLTLSLSLSLSCTHTHTHHAYLSGATLPPRAGFLLTRQADNNSLKGYFSLFSFPPLVAFTERWEVTGAAAKVSGNWRRKSERAGCGSAGSAGWSRAFTHNGCV